ncbi:hypothetical protein BDR07DRAFT_1498253 [Suillus spraguei]|nr:hypothetical protein BDR07DRAFT_1498253 [Suillus spraguei]
MTNQPIHSNANRNPAQVILDATQKRRTTSQKQADKALAAKVKSTQAQTSLKEHQRKIKTIATAEDNLRQEDKEYRTSQLETLTIAEQMKSVKAKQKAIEADSEIDEDIARNLGSDYEASRTSTDLSNLDSDDLALEMDYDELEEQENKNWKSKISHKAKQCRGMRGDISTVCAIPAEAGAKFKKHKEVDQSEDIEAEIITTAKRKKHNQATNLQHDWKKKIGKDHWKGSWANQSEPHLIPSAIGQNSWSSSRSSWSGMTATGTSSGDELEGEDRIGWIRRTRGPKVWSSEEQRSRGAEEQRSRGAEEQRSRGAEEQRSRGAEERMSIALWILEEVLATREE